MKNQKTKERIKKVEDDLENIELMQMGKYRPSLTIIQEESINNELSMYNGSDTNHTPYADSLVNKNLVEEVKNSSVEFTIEGYLQAHTMTVDEEVQTVITEDEMKELLKLREAYEKVLNENKNLKQENERLKYSVKNNPSDYNMTESKTRVAEYELEIAKLKEQLKESNNTNTNLKEACQVTIS